MHGCRSQIDKRDQSVILASVAEHTKRFTHKENTMTGVRLLLLKACLKGRCVSGTINSSASRPITPVLSHGIRTIG